MPSKNKIGEAYVEITADARDLDRNLDKSQQKVREYSSTAERNLNRVDGAMDKNAKSSKRLADSFTGLIGKVTAFVGAAYVLVRASQAVNQTLRDGTELADEFSASLGGTQWAEAQQSLKAYQQELANVNARLAVLQNSGIRNLINPDFYKELFGQLSEQEAALQERVEQFAQLNRIRRQRDREEEAKKFAEAIEREVTKALQNAIDRATASRRNSFNSVGLLEAATDSLLANSPGSISVGGG